MLYFGIIVGRCTIRNNKVVIENLREKWEIIADNKVNISRNSKYRFNNGVYKLKNERDYITINGYMLGYLYYYMKAEEYSNLSEYLLHKQAKLLGYGTSEEFKNSIKRNFLVNNVNKNVPEILQWYDLKEIRVRTADESPITIVLHPKLGFEKDNTEVLRDLRARNEIIVDKIRWIFSNLKVEQLRLGNETDIKNHIRREINKLVVNSSIKDIIFLDFTIIEF